MHITMISGQNTRFFFRKLSIDIKVQVLEASPHDIPRFLVFHEVMRVRLIPATNLILNHFLGQVELVRASPWGVVFDLREIVGIP